MSCFSKSCRWYSAGSLFIACTLACTLALGQEPAARMPASHAYQDNHKCLDCHERQIRRSDFLGDSSASVWHEYDKHRDAFRLLYMGKDENDAEGAKRKQELVKRILGFDLREAFVDDPSSPPTTLSSDPTKARQVATVKACLRCHATLPLHEDRALGNGHPPVPLELGVSCQACHGAGLKWTEPHTYTWWRLVTPAGKASLGFRDVRDAGERAKLCTSCHVGNYAEGKFVTHEWYAGGHPPLPGFEYATFAAQMPVHWRSLREKTQFVGKEADNLPADLGVEQRATLREVLNTNVPENEVRSSYREANFPKEAFANHDPFADLPRTKEVIVSGTVALQTYVALLKDYSEAVQTPPVADRPEKQAALAPSWPEFAMHDCGACHHELRSGPGYPLRPFGNNAPGRPPALVWPTALLRLGVLQSVGYDAKAAEQPLAKVEQGWGELQQALTARPFGDPRQVAAAAAALQADLDTLIVELKHSRYDEAGARQALLFLTDPKQVETRDYYSARQIAWAVREISKDAAGVPYGTAAADNPQVAAINALFNKPDDVLALKLPSTQQESIIEHMQETLPAIANHDPAWFAQRLAEIHAELTKGGK